MLSALRSDLILGIETSCDETAAAVLRGPRDVLSNIVASQVPVHRRYGGVVPELASRQHLLAIGTVIEDALSGAGVHLDDLGGIAVTYGPGLVGSLLVGISVAKALAMARDLPLAAVNHHEGHIRSLFIENGAIPCPAVVLMVSGGDTSLYLMQGEGRYRGLAHTRDDAAGEAFDKVAKLLGLGYPGGPIIDRLARDGDPASVRFSRPRMSDGSLDFSFSGMKTAVLRYVQEHAIHPVSCGSRTADRADPGTTDLTSTGGTDPSTPALEEVPSQILDLVASFQETVVRYLVDRTVKAVRLHAARAIGLSGGVACNNRLREMMRRAGDRLGLPVYCPSPILTTDNAAMIASAGFRHLEAGRRADLTLNADPSARL
ncbi:MAG: tRNA (adenosine(37)-N6)-threonylcarbamoyltransferase complex transferase subunit TsaD [Acidobacteriota bacterium]